MTREPVGVALTVAGRTYFAPLSVVAWVSPLRGADGDHLDLPRGRVPLLRLPGGGEAGAAQRAVVVRASYGFFALAAERAELVDEAPEGSRAINVESLPTAAQRRAIERSFAEGGASAG